MSDSSAVLIGVDHTNEALLLSILFTEQTGAFYNQQLFCINWPVFVF